MCPHNIAAGKSIMAQADPYGTGSSKNTTEDHYFSERKKMIIH